MTERERALVLNGILAYEYAKKNKKNPVPGEDWDVVVDLNDIRGVMEYLTGIDPDETELSIICRYGDDKPEGDG